MLPIYVEHGIVSWVRTGKLPATGYADLKNGVVHLLVLSWLLWWPRYRDYCQKRLAHEWMHVYRNDSWHEDAPGDVMSRKVWNATTDKHLALSMSAQWRSAVWRHG